MKFECTDFMDNPLQKVNVEFPWESSTLSEKQTFQGPSIRITTKMTSN